jgi:hypothetical protein
MATTRVELLQLGWSHTILRLMGPNPNASRCCCWVLQRASSCRVMKRGVAHLVKAYPVLPHLRTAESNYRKLTPRVPDRFPDIVCYPVK